MTGRGRRDETGGTFAERDRQAVRRSLRLSERQLDISMILLEGATIRGAADRLGLRPDTVKTHVKRIYRRLRIHSRAELGARVSEALRGPPAGSPDAQAKPPRRP